MFTKVHLTINIYALNIVDILLIVSNKLTKLRKLKNVQRTTKMR